MHFKPLLCTAVAVTSPCMFAHSQEQRRLSIEEMFSLADSASHSIAAGRYALEESAENSKMAMAAKLPEISAEISAGYMSDGWITDRDYSNGFKAGIPHFANGAGLTLYQPLFTGGAISSGVESARIVERISELSLMNTTQNVRYELLAYLLDIRRFIDNEKVMDSNIALADSLISNISSKFENGAALENDITRYRIRRHDLTLQREQIISARRIINHRLAVAIGLDPDVEIIPDVDVECANDYKGKDWEVLALDGSAGLGMAEQNVLLSEMEVRSAKAARLPALGLYGSAQMTGPITIEIPAMNNNFSFFTAGLSLTYNFSTLFKDRHTVSSKKSALSRSRSELEEAKEQVSNAVTAAYIMLEESEVEVETMEKALELAEDNYRIIERRYLEGLAILTDMLDAENALLSARLQRTDALITRTYRYWTLIYICSEL